MAHAVEDPGFDAPECQPVESTISRASEELLKRWSLTQKTRVFFVCKPFCSLGAYKVPSDSKKGSLEPKGSFKR